MKKLAVCVLLLCAAIAAPSSALIRESAVNGAPGLRYEELRFEWDHVMFNIVNMTEKNYSLSGSICFIDSKWRVVATAEMLPQRVCAMSKLPCRAVFTLGSGEMAEHTELVEWRNVCFRE